MQPLQRHSAVPGGLTPSANALLAPRSQRPPSRPKPCGQADVDLIKPAYGVLYDVHAHVAQLVDEAAAYLNSALGALVTATGTAKVQPNDGALFKQDSTAAAAAESLLQRCLAMQALLQLDGSNTAASPSAARRLASALSVLVTGLPADWQALLATQPEKQIVGGVGVAAAAPPRQDAASAADGNSASAEGTAASSTKRGSAAPAVAGLMTSLSDLVQVALLLRRRWELQRDLDLLVVALRDICCVVAAGGAGGGSGDDLKASAAENVPLPPPAVAVALAMLQLPRAPPMLAAHEKRMWARGLPAEVTANGTAPYSYPYAATMLLVWLWRASCIMKRQHSEGSSVQSVPSTTAAPATAVMSALTSARQFTELLFKWEAHLARYVSAVLAGSSSVPLLQQQQDSAYGSAGSSAAPRATPLLQQFDEDFLSDIQAEMSLEHGACNEVQLLWLTTASAVVAAAGAGASRGGMLDVGSGPLASAEVGKQCGKAERALRAICSTSAVARALLPGVLLLQGCANARRRSGPEALVSGAQSRELRCWMEAYSLGRQVLGDAHPVVEAAAALLPNSAVASSSEQQPTAPAPASHMHACAAALPGAHHSPTATLSGSNLPLPLVIRARLPPLPPVSTAALRPPQQASPRSAPEGTRLAPPRPPPAVATHPLCPMRPPQSPPLLSWSGPSSQSSGTGVVTARAHSSGRAPSSGYTFSLSFASPAAASAAAADCATNRLRLSPPQSWLSAVKSAGGQSLRHCYRLQRPEDAFTLHSSVKDAMPLPSSEDDASAAAAAKAKKKPPRRLRDSKGNPPTSTATLLLSAMAAKPTESATTLNSGVDSDSQARRRWKRDRDFSVGLPVSGAHSSGLLQPKQQQQQPEAVQVPQQDKLYEDGPLTLAAAVEGVPTIESKAVQQHSSGSGVGGGATDEKAVGASASSMADSVVTAGQYHNSSFMSSFSSSMRPKEEHAPHAQPVDDAGTDVDEEEEETLPERNARFQREIISYYVELNERRATAALTIQMAWRAAKAREILRARRQALYRHVYTIQKAAALAIDGYLACVLEQRRRIATLHTRAAVDKQRREQEQREVSAALRLTRAVRLWLQRQRERRRLCKELSIAHDAQLQLYAIVAVKVQQWWRRVVVEKAYWRRRTAEVAEQQRLQAEAERQAYAAATIQRRVRGMQARRRVAQLRVTRKAEAIERRRRLDAATTVLTIVLQEYARRQDRLRREVLALEESREEAAQRIAAGWRRTVERRRLELAVRRARQLRTSALCIQRAWRRYAAGHQLRYLRQLRRTVQQERLASEALTYEVLRLLQCFGRSAQAQLLVRRLKARRGRTFMENLFLIQAAGRGALVRAEVARMRMAGQARQLAAAQALETQRRRAISLLHALLREHASAALVQRRRRMILAEKLAVHTTAAREMREDAAAIVLQRAVRRHQTRQRTAATEADAAATLAFLGSAARRLQQAWRRFAAQRERRHRAAAVAQCARKRREWEEVWQLVWQDQFTELDLLCVLERQYIEEQQHVERVQLYNYLCSPDATTPGDGGAQPSRAFDIDAGVLKWAALYGE
ncbi:hypothetical protein LSCM1_07088 [Leishmania martiniquensis]|uniref:Uncharacterized protein n=1 Tax=Leishmania martiniquensis TaxID=1580590 RepID=A0A836HYU0_9TRYP|nr:hypothetical protein LSCM1_07088 [Leishmania martiniquensis]